MRAKRAKAAPVPLDPGKTMLLPAVLDLKAAGPLADELLALRGNGLQIDGSAVQRVGAQCVQVLLAARQTWAADRVLLAVVGASEPLRSSAALLGATTALFDPLECNP